MITILQSLLISLWKLSGKRKYSYVIKKFSIQNFISLSLAIINYKMMAHFVASTLIIIRMLDDFVTLKCEENFNYNENIYRKIHLITIIQCSLISLWKLSGKRKYSYVIKKYSVFIQNFVSLSLSVITK